METYNINIWYRYVAYEGQEKDYQDFKIKSSSLKEAMVDALSNFKSQTKIPFLIECGSIKIKPNKL
jgi:hypothetical protein